MAPVPSLAGAGVTCLRGDVDVLAVASVTDCPHGQGVEEARHQVLNRQSPVANKEQLV